MPRRSLTRWQDSVVGVWTPTAHASGFVIDANGLVVTNQRGIGLATSVEVQFSPTLKVAASVVVADAARDVAVDSDRPKTAAAVSAVPLGCGDTSHRRQPRATGSSPSRRRFAGRKTTTSGLVRQVAAGAIESDIDPGMGGSGRSGVHGRWNGAVGITSEGEKRAPTESGDQRVVRMSDVCAVVEPPGRSSTPSRHRPPRRCPWNRPGPTRRRHSKTWSRSRGQPEPVPDIVVQSSTSRS